MTPDLKTLLHDIDAWGDRLIAAGRIDNLSCKGVWLKLWGDGSGSVMAEYAKCLEGETDGEKLVNTVFMEPSSILDFDSLDELAEALSANRKE